MKKILMLLTLACGLRCMASDALTVFRAGLEGVQKVGPEVLLSAWYLPEEAPKVEELRQRFNSLSNRLGPVIDSEIFAPKAVGRRLTHLYGVVYFRKRPVWIRADYYNGDGSGGFIHLEFSLKPDDILPFELGGRAN